MKKTGIALGLCVFMALACAGCSADKVTDYTASSDEIQVPDDVEVPDAASAVENILNNEDVVDIPEMDENALEELETQAAEAEDAPKTDVDIYYVFGSYDEFQMEADSINQDFTPDEVLKALASHNIVPLDCKSQSMELKELEDGTEALYLDLSGSFTEYLNTMSDEARDAVIDSLADTFIKAYDADCLYLTVDSNPVLLSDGSEPPLVWKDSPKEAE